MVSLFLSQSPLSTFYVVGSGFVDIFRVGDTVGVRGLLVKGMEDILSGGSAEVSFIGALDLINTLCCSDNTHILHVFTVCEDNIFVAVSH